MSAPQTRREHDLLGDLEVPAGRYYGVHTARALQNFAITGIPVAHHRDLVVALALVKQASAQANRDAGLLPADRAAAVIEACAEIAGGRLHEEFVVDVVQGGAGTSTNMNANEVIANRGLELLGHARGCYEHLHPLDDVNRSQSTNDVYPTAVKIALHRAADRLAEQLESLHTAFAAKAGEFGAVLKVGRTQLQDAVPMTLGQEFAAFAATVAGDRQQLAAATAGLRRINLGGTAIGTGLNAPTGHAAAVRGHLAELTGIAVETAPDLIEATGDVGPFLDLSGVLRRIAVRLSKICNDLRLLSSGPRAGLGEICLPAVQAGSSAMPGKVNPVVPEVVNQIAFQVIGHDLTVTLAAEGGQLQLNAFEPVIAHCLLESLAQLTAGCRVLGERCVPGITADAGALAESVRRSIGVVTALVPRLGYPVASALAQEALVEGRDVVDLATSRQLLGHEEAAELLGDLHRLAGSS